MGPNGREALRAVYLASPLKFSSTLHAFTRGHPRFFIDPWEKDPCAFHRHKWNRVRQRKKGSYFYYNGPLAGVKLEGWPEPGLLGAVALVQAASRAQSERLQDTEFWQQVCERAVKLRDVIAVGDLAVILDALVTANYRHTHLLKTLTRELIDDVDKLSLVEAAAVASAYAFFNCYSEPLLKALVQHVLQLLSGLPLNGNHGGGTSYADPQSLSVFMKALASLNFHDAALMQAIAAKVSADISKTTFASLADVLTAFTDLQEPFEPGTPDFSSSVALLVPGSRLSALCPGFLALAKLGLASSLPREALVAEILAGLKAAPAPGPQRNNLAIGRLPAFGHEPVPAAFVAAAPTAADRAPVSAGYDFQASPESDVGDWAVQDPARQQEVEDDLRSQGRIPRFYNVLSRRLVGPRVPSFATFDPTTLYNRNIRGTRVAQAMEALNILWRGQDGELRLPTSPPSEASTSGASASSGALVKRQPNPELELLEVAGPLLRNAVQGLTARQLASCSELVALQAKGGGSAYKSQELLNALVLESVRKLSNFKVPDLRRLHAAASSLDPPSAVLERARWRRFPRALRKELRKSSGNAVPQDVTETES